MRTAPAAEPLSVHSRPVTDPGTLTALLPEGPAVAWLLGGDGMVGWGEAARLDVAGPDRFARAASWWRELVGQLVITDEVGVRGSGPVAFGSFAFDARPGQSTLMLPRVLVGRRHGVVWTTTVGDPPPAPAPTPTRQPVAVAYPDEPGAESAFVASVRAALDRIRAGELTKAVLARDLYAEAAEPVDPRWLLRRLAAGYPACWTFAVDGLVGATPELLVCRQGDRVRSRVLAGTADPHADPAELLHSAKDLAEHAPAVTTLAERLAPHCVSLEVPDTPRVLDLPNVRHLATDVTGRLADDSDVLSLVAALHPTAAVAGSPTPDALRLIHELEGADRGRYAGPVGWVDAAGDGEWCIALRCATVDGARVRMYAGCGIVADSDPAAELAEWAAKLRPVREALTD